MNKSLEMLKGDAETVNKDTLSQAFWVSILTSPHSRLPCFPFSACWTALLSLTPAMSLQNSYSRKSLSCRISWMLNWRRREKSYFSYPQRKVGQASESSLKWGTFYTWFGTRGLGPAFLQSLIWSWVTRLRTLAIRSDLQSRKHDTHLTRILFHA